MKFIKAFYYLFFLISISCSKNAEVTIQHKLTVSAIPSTGGAVTPGNNSYNKGQTITLLATPSAEYIFKEWSGSLSGSTNPSSITMNTDKNVIGTFEKRQYPLNLTIDGQGTVKEEIIEIANNSQYPSGTSVKLTAQPGANFKFKDWSGDLNSTTNPLSIVVNKSLNLKLTFINSDSDEDGVFDGNDKCPNTPKGESVDSNGCSKSQIDSDKDGIFDNLDKCPNTPQSEVTDSNGCSKSQIDTDGDGIPDIKDQDNKTRKGVPVDANGLMLNPIYLDKNGVTIKANDWGIVGDIGFIGGVKFVIIGLDDLKKMIFNNEDYSNVCTSRIIDLSNLFFNKQIVLDISRWDVSNVTSIYQTFTNSTFNGDISNWDVSKVVNMAGLFYNTPFNQNISNWNVGNVTNMYGVFYKSKFNQDISNWNVSNVIFMGSLFHSSPFNKPISKWDVSKVTQMTNMFYDASFFNQDISGWNVSNVTTMAFMFNSSRSFNQNISRWNVSKVTNMSNMFEGAPFNQDLSSWNVVNVTTCDSFAPVAILWTLPKPKFTNCNPGPR